MMGSTGLLRLPDRIPAVADNGSGIGTRVRKGFQVISLSHINTDLVLDDVHSFVLRVSLDRAYRGSGKPRPQFHLEHVNKQTVNRAKSLEEMLEQLRTQILSVFKEIEFH